MSNSIDTIWMTALFQSCPVGMVIFGDNGKIAWANEEMARLTRMPMASLLELTESDTSQNGLACIFERPAEIEVEGDTQHLARFLGCEYKSIEAPNGTQIEAGFFTDISDRKMLEDRIDRLVLSDETTGTLNLRGIMRDLEPLISRCRRYENPLSVLQIEFDVDADADLEGTMLSLSRVVRSQLRWADLVSRNTDNSFLLVLPETDNEAAQHLAGKLLNTLEANTEVELPPYYCATAEWQRGNDMNMLIKRINAGMVQAREENKVVAA